MADWQEDTNSSIELSDSDLEEAGLDRQVVKLFELLTTFQPDYSPIG